MKEWLKGQWEQTKEAAAYSWKYEIGWGRIIFLLAMVLVIIAMSNFLTAFK